MEAPVCEICEEPRGKPQSQPTTPSAPPWDTIPEVSAEPPQATKDEKQDTASAEVVVKDCADMEAMEKVEEGQREVEIGRRQELQQQEVRLLIETLSNPT